MYKQKPLILMTIALVGLSACANIEEKLSANGATRLDADQVKSHIVGNTERWTKGGGYYNPDGILETVWEGATSSGPYTIAANGNVCYAVKTWDRNCHFYMNDGGTVTMIYKNRNVGTRDVLTGDQLSTL